MDVSEPLRNERRWHSELYSVLGNAKFVSPMYKHTPMPPFCYGTVHIRVSSREASRILHNGGTEGLKWVQNWVPHGWELKAVVQVHGSLTQHLNTQHRNIKFTVEHEKENKLAFLDVQVTRTNNRLTKSVYRKPTHTDRYIPFHPHHHQRTVNGVLRCMQDRATKICDPTSKQKEFQHSQAVFQANGFPAELVRKTPSHQTRPTPPQPVYEDPAEPQKIMCLPYIRGLSERIERICTLLKVKAAFKPTKTLRQTLMNVKNCVRKKGKERWYMRFRGNRLPIAVILYWFYCFHDHVR